MKMYFESELLRIKDMYVGCRQHLVIHTMKKLLKYIG